MRKTFHLRFVPFGTSFQRAEATVRHSPSAPDVLVLGDNEIVVDVGGCCFGYPGPGASEPEKSLIFDHHFSRPNNYPSASAAVLHHAADIVKLLAAHDDIWIVTHQEPDFDALCAVYLVKALLGGTTGEADDQALLELDPTVIAAHGLAREGWTEVPGNDGSARGKIDWFHPDVRPSVPGGWAILLAAYASCVDSGKRLHADRCRRLHSVLYAAILRRRSAREDGMEALFSEARRAIVSRQLNPIFDALFDDHPVFAPELELLANETRIYERDMARARKSIVSLQVGSSFEEWYPALATIPLVTDSGERNPVHWNGVQVCEIREADGVYLRDPECLLFKEWAREDLENSCMGSGFLFTAVAYTRNRTYNGAGNVQYFFALDPEKAHGAHLYNVWAALQFGEVAALKQRGMQSEAQGAVRSGFGGRAGDLTSCFVDPWFDGANYHATIVVSPYRGTLMAAGQAADLTDDSAVRIVMRELELGVFSGPASLLDYSLTVRRSSPDGRSEASAVPEAEVVRRTVDVEEAPRVELLPAHYRFGKVQIDDRHNLSNRRFAEQVGRQLWPFLEPAGVDTCPSDFATRHLVIAPACITVWSRRGIVVAYTSDGREEAESLETRLGQVAGVAREVRFFQSEVSALLAGDRSADTSLMQVRSHFLLQRIVDLQLAAAMPENSVLRRFYDATRFDGVLGMLNELSTAVVRYIEARRAALQTRLLAIVGAMFSLLSAWSAVAALATVKLEDFSFQSWSDWREHPALVLALAVVSLGVLVTLSVALLAPTQAWFDRKRERGESLSRHAGGD